MSPVPRSTPPLPGLPGLDFLQAAAVTIKAAPAPIIPKNFLLENGLAKPSYTRPGCSSFDSFNINELIKMMNKIVCEFHNSLSSTKEEKGWIFYFKIKI